MTETTIPTDNATNENSISENNSSNENSVSENHKYNPSKDHLVNCESCRILKKKINDDYYANNTDKILSKRKEDRISKMNKLNNVVNNDDQNNSEKLDSLNQEEKEYVNSIPIGKVNYKNYMVNKKRIPKDKDHKYVFPKGLERIFKKYSRKVMSRGLILIGHAGGGKTESIIAHAEKMNYPILETSLHDEIRSTDLLGSFTLNKTFELGNFPKAIEIANDPENKSHTCVLLLDEVNTQNNHVQKLSNNNLDFIRGITIPLIEKRFQLKENCHVIVLGTMNYSSYSGTYQLNLEYNSRFDFKFHSGMADPLIRKLLRAKKIDDQTIESLIITNKELLKAFEEEKIFQPIDPRGLLKFAEDYLLNIEDGLTKSEATKEAIELTLVGRYLDNKDDLKFVSEIIESNFSSEDEDEDQTNNDQEDQEIE